MITACGCPPDTVIRTRHSLEVCSGRWRPKWECILDEGRVLVYDTHVVAILSDDEAANPCGLWAPALSSARIDWTVTQSAAASWAIAAIEDARGEADAGRYERHGRQFAVRLTEAPKLSLATLWSEMERFIAEKAA